MNDQGLLIIHQYFPLLLRNELRFAERSIVYSRDFSCCTETGARSTSAGLVQKAVIKRKTN